MSDRHVINRSSNPLVSVIVPAFNAEDYLSRCLDSILEQTYENLEVIVVDDASLDSTGEIIHKYMQQDDRVAKADHEVNRGLLQARITGVDRARGKYIAFVDSDDYISIDWFRLLVNKAEETESDIVVGEWCFDNDGESITYINLDPFRIYDYSLQGHEVLKAFMEQEGLCFSWTVIWNKLYKKSLWDKCADDFKRFSEEHGHMLMWEDIAFSSGLWTKADLVSNVHGINYYYYKHSNASTAYSRNQKRNQKYIYDSSCALKFMKTQLEETSNYSRYEKNYTSWKKRAASLLYKELVLTYSAPKYESMIRDAFEFSDEFIENEEFFYHISTSLGDSFKLYEDCKRQICSTETECVSFDIFDTLISRPFLEPDGLFHMLSDVLNAENSAYVDYFRIRKNAERLARDKKWLGMPSCEEITLDEIYDEIKALTVLSDEQLEEVKNKEIELEVSLCKTRLAGKELYELALYAGKRVIICSDMYLPVEVIEQILKSNGYTEYDKIYLSSDLKKTKSSGNLFSFVLKDLKIRNPKRLLHVGDNYASDIESPQKKGIRAVQLFRSESIFRNNSEIYGGEFFRRTYENNNRAEDYLLTLNDYPAAQCLLALVANKFYDNPYVSFNRESDFNADPGYVGYAALGPHLLALAKWIEKEAAVRHAGAVHFVARDGYMVKRAFDLINRSDVRSNYIRLSRTSLILADIDNPSDLYSLVRKISVYNCTPNKLLEYLTPIISEEKKSCVKPVLVEHKFDIDTCFASENEFCTCLKVLIEEILDFSLLPKYKQQLKEYFSEIIKPGDYIFDIGYSGRPEAALSNILGFPVCSFYIHENSEIAAKRQQHYHVQNICFYQHKPKITGVMREHLLMELGPSTVGYEEVNGKLQPLLENYEEDYCGNLMTKLLQENAIQFIDDFLQVFGNHLDDIIIPLDFLSAGFEYYMHYSKPFDREMFSTLVFEDNLGDGKMLKALDFWNSEIEKKGLEKEGIEYFNYLTPDSGVIYVGGFYAKLYRVLNKWFPVGSGIRGLIRKISSIFLR